MVVSERACVAEPLLLRTQQAAQTSTAGARRTGCSSASAVSRSAWKACTRGTPPPSPYPNDPPDKCEGAKAKLYINGSLS